MKVDLECPNCEEKIVIEQPVEGITGRCIACNTHLEIVAEYYVGTGLVFDLVKIEE